jgi:WD40 repeat protein
MMRRDAFLLACGMLFGAAVIGAASGTTETARSIIASGHAGAILGLEFDEKRGLLFSSGVDGTVRLWEADTGSLVQTLQVTRLRAEKIAINPVRPQFAVIVTDNAGSHSISVWDWELERQMYRVPLREDPQFLRFSGMGSYILWGESSWQSLKIIRAEDGAPVAFHPEGFGIVGFAEMSRSEKTLMTYLVSGRMTYWDMATGEQTLDLTCVPYLSGIRMSRDKSRLVGSTGREIYVLDTVTGATRGHVVLAGATAADFSPTGAEIACISGTGGLLRLQSSGDPLAPSRILPQLPQSVSVLCFGSDALYAADSAGGLHSLAGSGNAAQFGWNVLADISGFDAARGRIALGSQNWVRVFSSDMLTGAFSPTFIRSFLVKNPFSVAPGLAFTSEGKLLAWKTDAAGQGLAALDTSNLGAQGAVSGPFLPLPAGYRAGLSDLRFMGNEAIGIEAGSVVQGVDLLSGKSKFEVRIPGASTAVRVSPAEIIVARNATSAAEGSLVRVNMGTGETVALRGRDVYTFLLLFDPGREGGIPALYSVGVDSSGSTNLLRHDGPGFARETLLDSVPVVDLNVALAFDSDARMLYATLGQDRTIAWDGLQVRTIELENAAPRGILARDHMLFSLNKDSTVTVADSATGRWLARVGLFKDGEWCVILRDGRYAASTGGDLNVQVIAHGSPVLAKEDYRLRIEMQ